MYANKFCDAGQVPIFRYFEACFCKSNFCQATIFNPLPAPKNMHLPLSLAVVIDLYICSQHELFSVFLDSIDPGQTGPRGAV